jgi:hypothetical protein
LKLPDDIAVFQVLSFSSRFILKPTQLLLALVAYTLCTANAWSDESPVPAQAPSARPASATVQMADRCSNFTTNTWGFKAPRNFLKWLDVFSDPGIYLEYAKRGMDPQFWVAGLDSLMDPGTPKNYLEWTNPEIYNNWARAAADPEYYTAVNSILFDPGRMMRWAMLPLDGKTWELAGIAINPATWLKWLNAPADTKTQELFSKAANPETIQRWLEALGDPKNTPWFTMPTTPRGIHPAKMPSGDKKPAMTGITL